MLKHVKRGPSPGGASPQARGSWHFCWIRRGVALKRWTSVYRWQVRNVLSLSEKKEWVFGSGGVP